MNETKEVKIRSVKLKTWAANHSAVEIARQCGNTRQAVHEALRSDRKIKLRIRDGVIVDAVEDFGRRSIWGFKL